MWPSGERLLTSSGRFIAIRALEASAEQRAQALHPVRALSVLEELARDARSGNRSTVTRLLALLPFAPSFVDLQRVPSDALLAPIEQALERKQLLFVPGWDWARSVSASPARAAAARAPREAATTPSALRSAARSHELRFEYSTNTGYPITDDDGFELRGPSGAVEKGKLANGRLQRTGVEPGAYELRTRSIKSAGWSTASAAPFEPVDLIVMTRGLPDGTPLDVTIRSTSAPPDAAPARVKVAVKADRAVASWAYEQAVGALYREQFQFEVGVGKKSALSDLLTINPHPADTPRGAQEHLRARGYDPGPPTDAVTAALRAALRRFQTDHPPLIAQGELDPFTIDLLDDPFA